MEEGQVILPCVLTEARHLIYLYFLEHNCKKNYENSTSKSVFMIKIFVLQTLNLILWNHFIKKVTIWGFKVTTAAELTSLRYLYFIGAQQETYSQMNT